MLVLTNRLLIELIWDLKVVPGEQQIEMQRVAAARVEIEPVKEACTHAGVMKNFELRCIQKAAGPLEIESGEVSKLSASNSKRSFLLSGTECAVRAVEASSRPGEAKARFGDHVHDQACLVAILRRNRSADNFDGLNRVGRELGRKGFALLIRHRLIVDRVTGLRMVAQRMKQPVRIGDDRR